MRVLTLFLFSFVPLATAFGHDATPIYHTHAEALLLVALSVPIIATLAIIRNRRK